MWPNAPRSEHREPTAERSATIDQQTFKTFGDSRYHQNYATARCKNTTQGCGIYSPSRSFWRPCALDKTKQKTKRNTLFASASVVCRWRLALGLRLGHPSDRSPNSKATHASLPQDNHRHARRDHVYSSSSSRRTSTPMR